MKIEKAIELGTAKLLEFQLQHKYIDGEGPLFTYTPYAGQRDCSVCKRYFERNEIAVPMGSATAAHLDCFIALLLHQLPKIKKVGRRFTKWSSRSSLKRDKLQMVKKQ